MGKDRGGIVMFDGFIVIQKAKLRGKGNIVINIGYEMFPSAVDAEIYIKAHYCATKVRKPHTYENEDFIYEIKALHKVKEYFPSQDRITLIPEEE